MSMETDRIEEDLNQSRTRLNDTLQALGHKLSPGQMLDEAIGLVQGQGGQFAAKLGREVRDNPMPALLIGAGVAMLAMNARHHHAHSHDDGYSERRYRALEEARWSTARIAGETEDAFNDRLHAAYCKVLDLKQQAGEAAHDFKTRVSGAVGSARDAAIAARDRVGQAASGASHYVADKARGLGERAADVRESAQSAYQDTPLAAGAIALAIGALIGAATPLTDAERDKLQGVADKAARAGANLAEQGARMVEEKTSAMH